MCSKSNKIFLPGHRGRKLLFQGIGEVQRGYCRDEKPSVRRFLVTDISGGEGKMGVSVKRGNFRLNDER